MIEVRDLGKFYHGRPAISDVSFAIGEGEIVGLLGLNGAGKSTILKILGCFLLPSAGTAKVAGHTVGDDPQAIRRLIGYLPDTPPLYDEMRVDQYLTYVARLKNVPSSQAAASVAKVMERTNLTEVAGARLGELSHGFRQRASIAQALVHDPKVLILDEPINGLDPIQIVEMRDLILSLRGKYTVILSSHILSEITRTCDRMLIIDQGRLVAEGTVASLEANMVRSMNLTCEVESFTPDLERSISAIGGVRSVRAQPTTGGTHRLAIQADQDVRAAVARATVNAGLVGLARDAGGLEDLFLRLVQNSGPDRRGLHG